MEQIYYTQCPVGYGLGASNGFQVKRITPGYPVAGDFRHLGLRAFPAGGRSLAPPALRYRRVGEAAEVACLTPRAMEYETERGLWGRPGGHFAHGLILTREELRAVDDWPAGLYGSPCWRRADPEPSRGRVPEPVAISREDLRTPPDFASVAPLADGLDTGVLARLLAGLIAAARDGRTLFLIDEPDQLGPRVALLTFLVPRPLRGILTFSTYHDRPEELPGYRIHGTTPASRPNRALLLTQGIVADLTTGAVEPRADPPGWAAEIARWVSSGSGTAWLDFARRIAAAHGSPGFAPWDDGWLDRLVSFGRAVADDAAPRDWAEEVELAAWSASSNLSSEWAKAAKARLVGWPRGGAQGRPALLALAGWPESWKPYPPGDWGEVIARWFADAATHDREEAAVAFARGAPSGTSRFSFVQAMRRNLPEDAWAGVRQRLEVAFADDARTVTLWAVPEAVAAVAAGHPKPIRDVAAEFARLGESAEIVLEASRVEAEERAGPHQPPRRGARRWLRPARGAAVGTSSGRQRGRVARPVAPPPPGPSRRWRGASPSA